MKAPLALATLALLLVGCDDSPKTPPQATATPVTTNKAFKVLSYEYSVIVDKDTCSYFGVDGRNEGIFKCTSGNESLTGSYQNGKHTTYTSTGIIRNNKE